MAMKLTDDVEGAADCLLKAVGRWALQGVGSRRGCFSEDLLRTPVAR